MQVTNNWLTQS